MTELSKQNCEACKADAPLISDEELKQLMPKIEFKFKDFASALAFTNRVGEIAEDEGHHPAILTEWGK